MQKHGWWQLGKIIKGQVLVQEPMHRHTSWRIGGPAEVLVRPQDVRDLSLILDYAHTRQIPCHIIGNGTNLLVADQGVRGLVVKIGANLGELRVEENNIVTQAGVSLPRLAAKALGAGLAGFEFLAGIPGTVGGAIKMNAGANGANIGQLVQWVQVLDERGQQHHFGAKALSFAYRDSSFNRQKYVAIQVCLAGQPGSREQIKQKTDAFLARRRQTQPLQYPNAGSVFKNPPGQAAGALIEQAGCKGMQVGQVQVSTLHANFFVNLGQGSAQDVLTLMGQVQQKVQHQFGCLLEPEVLRLGEF